MFLLDSATFSLHNATKFLIVSLKNYVFMKEQIKQRIALWKKIFAEGNKELNEDSPWLDILLVQNLDYETTVDKYTKAEMNYGCFTEAEKGSLEMRPAYKEAVRTLNKISQARGFWEYSSPISKTAYIRVILRTASISDNIVPVYEAIITTTEKVDFTDEIYIFIDGGKARSSKNIVLRYDTGKSSQPLASKSK